MALPLLKNRTPKEKAFIDKEIKKRFNEKWESFLADESGDYAVSQFHYMKDPDDRGGDEYFYAITNHKIIKFNIGNKTTRQNYIEMCKKLDTAIGAN